MERTQLQAVICTFEAKYLPHQWGTDHVQCIKHWYISVKPCWCNSSLPFVGRSWRRSPKFSYLKCAGRQQSPLLPSITQASFNLMTTLLTAKINMISVSQPNHSYKAKEPTGLYKFQHGVIFWFECNPRGIRNDWDYCRYLERDRGFWRPQLLLFIGRRRGSQQQGLCLAHASITSGLLEAFCVLRRTASLLPTASSWRTLQVLIGTRHHLPYS